MPISLENILIWSRSYNEYLKIFDLTPTDLQKKILSCADGASSFNKMGTEKNHDITSCDLFYSAPYATIKQKIEASYQEIFPKILQSQQDFIWETFKNTDELKQARLQAAALFLEDIKTPSFSSRYITTALPHLPFATQQFDIALCGNFLFLYSDILSEEFHIQSILEMLRVAKEVRLFPLIGNDRQHPKQLDGVLALLSEQSFHYQICDVDYHFTKGADQMLKITHPS